MPSSGQMKIFLAAGAVGLGVTVAAGYYYVCRQRKKQEETDEGIGDEDSIISDSEDPTMLRDLTTPTTVAPKGDEMNHFQFQEKRKDDLLAPHNVPQARDMTRTSLSEYIPAVNTKNKSPEQDDMSKSEQSPESSDSEEDKPKKVLILGLDGAGKTALVETLTKHKDRSPNEYKPTNGFNVAQARCDGVALNIMEVGGGETTRRYWSNFLQDTDLLIYVVDGSDHERFEEAKNALAKVLREESLSEVPCLLLSNKQDIAKAASCEKIITEKDLPKISSNRHLKLSLLDSICIPGADSTVQHADTLMAVILNLLE